MNSDFETLRWRYSLLSDEELLRLHNEGGLTESAESVLLETIKQRGIDPSRIDEFQQANAAAAAEEEAEAMSRPSAPLEGLGGWLILLSIGIWGNLITQIVYFVRDYAPVLFGDEFQQLSDPSSFYYVPLWKELMIVEILGAIVLLGTSVVTLYAFYSKKAVFPTLYISMQVGLLLWAVMTRMAADYIMEDAVSIVGPDLIRGIFTAAIWIAYLSMSERVENTFVKPWRSVAEPTTA